jgi:hypothetical protein
MMSIAAKFVCYTVKGHSSESTATPKEKYAEEVQFLAVYSDDPKSENYSWSQATPSGSLSLYITNPSAWGAFKQGEEYLIRIEEAAQ